MSFKIPTFCKVLAKFGPFLLLGGKLSVSASHRFSSPDDFFIFSGRSSGELFTPNRKFLVKVLKYLSEQRYPLTSPYTMTKRTTYYSNTTGGPATLTAGRDHKGHLPTNFRLQKAQNPPNDCPDEIKRQKTKDRMSMLRPLFLSEATRSTHTHCLPS